MTEKETLEYIYEKYNTYLVSAGSLYAISPSILAGIMYRESAGGLSTLLDKQGPEGRGDNGHGRGLMQIDDRWWGYFTDGESWKDAKENIKFGAYVLHLKMEFLKKKFKNIPYSIFLLRASIASYNAGEGNVLKAIRNGEDPDSVTAHHNYSQEVMRFAEIYTQIVLEKDRKLAAEVVKS